MFELVQVDDFVLLDHSCPKKGISDLNRKIAQFCAFIFVTYTA